MPFMSLFHQVDGRTMQTFQINTTGLQLVKKNSGLKRIFSGCIRDKDIFTVSVSLALNLFSHTVVMKEITFTFPIMILTICVCVCVLKNAVTG